MKTLDETIAELEDEELFADALHYLKELRDMTDIPMEYFEYGGTSQELRNTSQITCPKCHSEFVILDDPDGEHQQLEKCRALLQDFFRNDPLTWSQLKGMEGKPVWVEYDDHLPGRKRTKFKVWEVISYVSDDQFVANNDWSYHKDEMGDVWRAYRKERNDAQI